MFVVLTTRGFFQIGRGVADHAGRKSGTDFLLSPLQQLKEPFGVLLFPVGRFLENIGNLDKSLFFGLTGKIKV
jgi:hypothetical protein